MSATVPGTPVPNSTTTTSAAPSTTTPGAPSPVNQANGGLRGFKLIVAGDVLPHTQVVRAACGGSLRRDAPCAFDRLLQPTEADALDIITVNGVRIAHRSYTYGLNGLRLPKGQPFWVNLLSWQKILADTAKARAGGAEVVLISIHWGQEYRTAPTAEQKRLAAILTVSGQIDLIIGHHAHVVQPIALLNDRWVLYGLGNHLSAQVASKKRPASTQYGVMVEVGFSEQPDHTFVAARPVAHPTWVHPSTRQVFVVADTLRATDSSTSLGKALVASRNRASRVVGGFLPGS